MSGGEDLVFDGVGFGFTPAQLVLSKLDLRVRAGQVVGLIGLSGCGKSTVLRLAAGLLTPTLGTVRGGGRPRAFVFQRPTLLPWRTVAENVALALELAGPEGERADRVADALGRVGLADAADKLPRALSGGMAMRVSLARALVSRPRLLLLDEPFSSLDAFTRRQLQDEVLALQQTLGLTTLLVTHDVDEAALFADEVLVLKGQPATIGARLPIPLPRPRAAAQLRDPALAQAARTIEAAV